MSRSTSSRQACARLGLAFLVRPVAITRVLRRYALLAVVAGVLALAALAAASRAETAVAPLMRA